MSLTDKIDIDVCYFIIKIDPNILKPSITFGHLVSILAIL